MLTLIGLALLNGVLIATSRVINGHLGRKVGAVRSSLWNHAIGFVFLSLIVAAFFRHDMRIESAVPITAWLGGVLGVAFVALNSHAVPRLGAGKTTSFVVGAQMLASVAIDSLGRPFSVSTLVALGGQLSSSPGYGLPLSLARSSTFPAFRDIAMNANVRIAPSPVTPALRRADTGLRSGRSFESSSSYVANLISSASWVDGTRIKAVNNTGRNFTRGELTKFIRDAHEDKAASQQRRFRPRR